MPLYAGTAQPGSGEFLQIYRSNDQAYLIGVEWETTAWSLCEIFNPTVPLKEFSTCEYNLDESAPCGNI